MNASGKTFSSDLRPRVCRQDVGGLATANVLINPPQTKDPCRTRRDLFEKDNTTQVDGKRSNYIILVAPL